MSIGAKAENLHRLMRMGMRVPNTHVLTWEAFEAYQRDDLEIVPQLEKEIQVFIQPDCSYAIRSSANLEDQVQHSFAGQFKTVLDASGQQTILIAIWSIWASARNQGVQSYLEKKVGEIAVGNEQPGAGIKMAVIIQEMVRPVASGVVFSCNPVTTLDEIVIEAVAGPGTQLVQEGVTPLRWVNKWGQWLERPEPSPLPLEMVQQIVDQTHKIARKLGKQIDLEWVFDGKEVYWVQMREITSLYNLRIYTNKISKEVIPGQIKPLLQSTVIPMIVRQFADILKELSGAEIEDPSKLIRSFYYRIYFEMTAFGQTFEKLGLPRDALEIMLGVYAAPPGRKMIKLNPQMLCHIPRLLRLAWREWRFASEYHRRYNDLQKQYQGVAEQALESLELPKLLQQLHELNRLHQQTIHANVVVPVFMYIFNGMLKAQLHRRQIEFERFDLTEGLRELAEYQPDLYLQDLNRSLAALDPRVQDRLLAGGYACLRNLPEAKEFYTRLEAFLIRFGHLSDSGNDFSLPLWRENPDLILQMAFQMNVGRETSAHKLRLADLPGKNREGWLFHSLYNRSRYFLVQREKVSSMYTFSMSLYRRIYLTLGELLKQTGCLAEAQDIFYLYDAELRQAVRDKAAHSDLIELAEQRKKEMEASRDTLLPTVIYGDELPPLYLQANHKLYGTPTARGVYTGAACLVRSLQEFSKLHTGDVLVIPYSDVGWMPLFARAGAVVAESGGMLSHSSIIAREYGIPAVVSVCGALQLPEGATLTVDGYQGEVIVHDP